VDAYSSLIVQMSENRVNDLRRETRRRAASRLARLIARRRTTITATTPAPVPVALPAPAEQAEERRIA